MSQAGIPVRDVRMSVALLLSLNNFSWDRGLCRGWEHVDCSINPLMHPLCPRRPPLFLPTLSFLSPLSTMPSTSQGTSQPSLCFSWTLSSVFPAFCFILYPLNHRSLFNIQRVFGNSISTIFTPSLSCEISKEKTNACTAINILNLHNQSCNTTLIFHSVITDSVTTIDWGTAAMEITFLF